MRAITRVVIALALATGPVVAQQPSAGNLAWFRLSRPLAPKPRAIG